MEDIILFNWKLIKEEKVLKLKKLIMKDKEMKVLYREKDKKN